MGILVSAILLSIFSSSILFIYVGRHISPGATVGFIISSVVCGTLLVALYMYIKQYKTKPKTTIIGCLLILVPFGFHAFAFSIYSYQLLTAKYASSNIAINEYNEELIHWDGIDNPVGVKISFELTHPKNAQGLIYSPQIFLSNYQDFPVGDIVDAYFSEYSKEQKNIYAYIRHLSTALWNKKDGKESDIRFSNTGQTALSFHLYPETLEVIEENKFCIKENKRVNAYIRYNNPEEIAALWFAAHNAHVNMSTILTEKMNSSSLLKGNAALWNSDIRPLQARKMSIGAYTPCGTKGDQTMRRKCFCK